MNEAEEDNNSYYGDDYDASPANRSRSNVTGSGMARQGHQQQSRDRDISDDYMGFPNDRNRNAALANS